jgi:serine/threonine protein kinase
MPSINTRKQQRGRLFNKFKNKTLRNGNKRSKSLEPTKNTSEEIGSGGFGIVSRPPARCDSFIDKNFNQNAWRAAYYGNPNYISKLTEYTSAQRELEIALAIKEEIPFHEEYFCLVEFICNAPESKSINRNGDFYGTYAISPYCGTPLNQYLREDIKAPINIFELCNLVPSLQHMIKGLQQLHINHIYHKDIHDENILYDSESGLMRLIDFGLADDFRRIKSHNALVIISEEHHDLDMLVKNVIMPFVEFLLDDPRLSNSRIHIKYPYIEDFYYQMRKFYGQAYGIMNPKNKESFRNVDKEEQLTRLLNVVFRFRELQSINELAEGYFEYANNQNNRNKNIKNKNK